MGRRHMVASHAPKCLECGGVPRIVPIRQAFPHLVGEPRTAAAWQCGCGAAVSCHPNSFRPMGHCASSEASRARAAGHHYLDRAVEAGAFGRGDDPESVRRAYRWLATTLGVCGPFHFGTADLATARRACDRLRELVSHHRAARLPAP